MDQPRLRQRNVGRARRPGRRAGHRPGGAGRPRPAPAHPRSPPAAPSLGFPCARPARGPSLTPPSSRLRPAPPARGPRRHAARHELALSVRAVIGSVDPPPCLVIPPTHLVIRPELHHAPGLATPQAGRVITGQSPTSCSGLWAAPAAIAANLALLSSRLSARPAACPARLAGAREISLERTCVLVQDSSHRARTCVLIAPMPRLSRGRVTARSSALDVLVAPGTSGAQCAGVAGWPPIWHGLSRGQSIAAADGPAPLQPIKPTSSASYPLRPRDRKVGSAKISH
jgi:hypothetical protein